MTIESSISFDEYPTGLFLGVILNEKKFEITSGSNVFEEREGAEVDELNLAEAFKLGFSLDNPYLGFIKNLEFKMLLNFALVGLRM